MTVSVHFKAVPFCLFGGEKVCPHVPRNLLVLRIDPDEGISLDITSKLPEDDLWVGGVQMDFSYAQAFEKPPQQAYERLLLDCMRGDQTLFDRWDAVERAWAFVTPILSAWERDPEDVVLYEPGSSGPPGAEAWIARDGRRWRPLV